MKSENEKIANFDPNGVGALNGNLFGLPFTPEESEVIVIPVPWEVTVSYSSGTANGPQGILGASPQLDLYDPELVDAWKYGVSMLPIPNNIKEKSNQLRELAKEHIDDLESGRNELNNVSTVKTILIDKESEFLKDWIAEQADLWTSKGKKVCLVGGDHSTPLGLIEFLATQYDDFGILQIDAHADLRVSYEGFQYSHASIMYNAIKLPHVTNLTQVGIRDYCDSELAIINSNPKIITFFDKDLKEENYKGVIWDKQCDKIISKLPQNVYISFDIDGLDPILCPNTGTPVPGGLEFEQAIYLIKKVVESGRKIISFDICEVSPHPNDNEWNANVGARLLYRLSNMMLKSSI